MAGGFDALRRRVAKLQAGREKPTPLDGARYVAVSAGRLEPYLRALSDLEVWVCDPAITHVADDGVTFLHVWATRPRCVLAAAANATVSKCLVADAVSAYAPGAGVVVDPGCDTELTVEPHHLPTLVALHAGQARAEAFSAIGVEELAVTAAYRDADSADAPADVDGTEAQALDALPEGLTLARVEVELLGNPAGPRPYRVYFVHDETGQAPPLPADMRTSLIDVLAPTRVLVDPGTPDWRRDLLWDFRAWARPLTR